MSKPRMEMTRRIGKYDVTELFDLAKNQASYIHRDPRVVDEIALSSICELPLTSKKEQKRAYADSKKPTRPFLEISLPQLQRLVLEKSELHEKAEEANPQNFVGSDELIKRLIAFLVKVGLKQNSQYAGIGVCCILHNYKPNEARNIFYYSLPENNESDGDSQYERDSENDWDSEDNGDSERRGFCRKKKDLFDWTQKRFLNRLRIQETQNGKEKYFIRREDQDDPLLKKLVEEARSHFRPLGTQCSADGVTSCEQEHRIPSSYERFRKYVEDGRRQVEQLHRFMCPTCFRASTAEMVIDAPDIRLGIPKFFSNNPLDERPLDGPNGTSSTPLGGKGANGTSPAPLRGNSDEHCKTTPKERIMEELRRRLTCQAERLEQFIPEGLVTLKIDGEAVTNFNLDATNRIQFSVDSEAADRIEVIAQNEEVLAIHLLNYEVWEAPQNRCVYAVRHENGAKITFTFRPRIAANRTFNSKLAAQIENVDAEKNKLLVTVTYTETSFSRVLALMWRRRKTAITSWNALKEFFQVVKWANRIYANASTKLVAATLLIFISFVCYESFTQRRASASVSTVQTLAKAQQTGSTGQETKDSKVKDSPNYYERPGANNLGGHRH